MNPSDITVKIVAVIPCLDEEKFIGDIVIRTRRQVSKVIVVDDGSTDQTAEVATVSGAEVIRHQKQRGAGAATMSGFEAALKQSADIVIALDGDGQHDPDEIPLLLQPILDGQADLVIGSRFLKVAKVPTYRKLGIDVITWLYNLGVKNKIIDAQSGFRAYSKKTLESIHITIPGFGFSIQTLVQARKSGVRIVEVPISIIYHDQGSTVNPFIHGLSVAWTVVKIRFVEELFRTTPAKKK